MAGTEGMSLPLSGPSTKPTEAQELDGWQGQHWNPVPTPSTQDSPQAVLGMAVLIAFWGVGWGSFSFKGDCGGRSLQPAPHSLLLLVWVNTAGHISGTPLAALRPQAMCCVCRATRFQGVGTDGQVLEFEVHGAGPKWWPGCGGGCGLSRWRLG